MSDEAIKLDLLARVQAAYWELYYLERAIAIQQSNVKVIPKNYLKKLKL